MNKSYSDDSIRVLRGLEPVKQRPGMYTRTDNPLHILTEVVDNSADEALAGFAKVIAVRLHADGSVSVSDDGRGIPVGIHPEEGVSTVEVVYTRLHAGGKFDKKAGGAYQFSGGLHGVGVSVTNALSKRLEVSVTREGGVHHIVFSGGDVVEPLSQIRTAPKRATGTSVRIWPDVQYFDSGDIPPMQLERVLKAKAVLLPGVRVRLETEDRDGNLKDEKEWLYQDGLSDYLKSQLSDYLLDGLFWKLAKYAPASHEVFAQGEGAEWVLAWTEEGPIVRESYVNLIHTPAGGTHESGLRDGVFNALKSFIDHHSLLPKGVKLTADDVFSRISFVLSTKMLDPQFQGQTKDKLSSRDALRLVTSMVRDPLELWLNEHQEAAKRIADLAIKAAQVRQRAGQKIEKRKSSGVAVLPGKLADCQSDNLEERELFLVEGDSAGGSAKQGRNKDTQAILPLRGKVLNTWEHEADRIFANNEIHNIAVALGVDPHGPDDTPDLTGLRYARVIILADADVDGSHIQVLLLTLFYRHFPALVRSGRVCVAQPPLYRVDVPAQGKNKPARKFYCLDDGELEGTLDRLRADKVREGAWQVSRFKGLGEMNPVQLWETTLNPDARRLLVLRTEDFSGYVREVFNKLMAKSEAASRRAWMEEAGHLVEADE
ncbi:MAG: DNA topoisomerase IV subunit B [Gammaproteobacteria bacterium]|nr:DNA topoisomerase IV subunit B [Gammaproteobacteria bacterium]MBU1733492.1 DNA topoisomerase IV subunit B [Gammaproteobacteria bacterium]MBU1891909.1 DNA topoisomerase IV subunit B [Gammaproteobacteria bacterium]